MDEDKQRLMNEDKDRLGRLMRKELLEVIEEQEELIKYQQDVINHQSNLLDKEQREKKLWKHKGEYQ